MSMPEPQVRPREGPAGSETDAQLARIFASAAFRSSRRMQEFLTFIVNASAQGETGSLKEVVIGAAVFGRPIDYNPQIDAIVRVEARRLRKKLEQYYAAEGSSDPLVIELPLGTYAPTISYREPTAPLEAAEVPVAPRRPVGVRSGFPAWLSAGLLVVAAIAAFALSGFGRKSATSTPLVALPLTTFSGREFAVQISPDGKQIAFVWDGNRDTYNIYTRLLDVGDPVRVTTGSGHDLNPAWSSDGRYIAFVRVTPSEKTLRVVPALGGPERKLADLTPSEVYTWRADATQMYGSPGPAWSPDGRHVVVTDYPGAGIGGALTAISLDGQRRQLTRPAAGLHDFMPAFSPDGRHLAFARYSSAFTSELYVGSADGSRLRQLTADGKDIRGVAWLPDSSTIVFSSNRSRTYGLWKIGMDGRPASPVAAGGSRPTEPSVSRDGKLLAFTDTVRTSNVWRVGRVKPGQPELLIGSSRQSYCAHYSPDGRSIAFISDRSGSFEVWVSKADGSNPVQITNFAGPMVGSPRWSPDSQFLVFDARVEGHAAIFIVHADGRGVPPRRLEENSFEERMPSWSSDGRYIYYCSNRGGTVQLWKSPAAGGPAIRLTNRIAFTSFESPDGGTVYFTSLGGGLWQVPAAGGKESLVPELSQYHSGLYVWVAKSGIYLVDQETGQNVMHFPFATRRPMYLFRIPRTMVIDSSSLDVSPDESNIIFSQVDNSSSDIVLVRNWR